MEPSVSDALAVIVMVAGDVNELFITGDVITTVGAILIQLLVTGWLLILAAIPAEDVCKKLNEGFIYDTVITSP